MSRHLFGWVTPLVLLVGSTVVACAPPAPQAEMSPGHGGAEHHSQHDNHSMPMHEMPHGHGEHGMNLGPADENYDLRFIDAMILHHQGAIEMAQAAQAKSQRPEIQQLAAEIMQAQQPEIEQMQQWRQAWYPDVDPQPLAYGDATNPVVPMSEAQKQAMRMSGDLGAADAEFDRRFLERMIEHHQGAIAMSADAQSKSQRSEIQQLTTEIIQAQQQEINQMQQWRQAWYGN